jgi:phosphate transport system ATP-binding protein
MPGSPLPAEAEAEAEADADAGTGTGEFAVTLEHVTVRYGKVENAKQVAVRDVSLAFPRNQVTALLGPSGCGKTTILRTINRLHDHTTGRVSGVVRIGDLDVYARDTQPEIVRTRVGMVFQRPNLFPTLSIFDNVVAGLRMNGVRKREFLREAAEAALRQAALWDSVKNRLGLPAVRLSGGQQQRLCIARALAIEPEVLLLDEPCSALDPLASARIEELIVELSSHITIALVTHNLFQATRISHHTAVFLLDDQNSGTLVEDGPTVDVFQYPKDPRTQAYVTGTIG